MFLRNKSTISIIVLALILVAGGVWYAQRPAPEAPPASKPATPEVVTPGDNESGEVDTSDWKIYRNEELGFEVKYPEKFTYNYNKENDFFIGEFSRFDIQESTYIPPNTLTIYRKKENEKLSDFVDRFTIASEKLINPKKVILHSGVEAFQYDHIGAGIVNYGLSYFIDKGDYIYVFIAGDYYNYEDIANSFKFIDSDG